MTKFQTRRFPGLVPRIVGREPSDYQQELQEWMEKTWKQVNGGIPAGFNNIIAHPVVANAGSAGTQLAGWAAADHEHDGRHNLLDGAIAQDTIAATPAEGDIIAANSAAKWHIALRVRVYDSDVAFVAGMSTGSIRVGGYIGLGSTSKPSSYVASGTNGSCSLYLDRSGTGSPQICIVNGSSPEGEWKSSSIYLGSTASGIATPGSGLISGGIASGTDKAGGGLRISGGTSTGAATPASVSIRSSVAAASSSTLQTEFDAFTIGPGGDIRIYRTITPTGTTGNQTIDKPSGTVNIATGGNTVTVTNNLVNTSSIVHAVLRTADATAWIKNVVPGAGSFVINLGANATGEVSIGFLVTN